MSILDDATRLLGNGVDTDQLSLIIGMTQKRLALKLGVKEVPEELEYIITEVSIIRFNRIGSEGASSHSVEGESVTFSEDDFSAYESDIIDWMSQQEPKGRKAVMRFL